MNTILQTIANSLWFAQTQGQMPSDAVYASMPEPAADFLRDAANRVVAHHLAGERSRANAERLASIRDIPRALAAHGIEARSNVVRPPDAEVDVAELVAAATDGGRAPISPDLAELIDSIPPTF